MKKIYMFMTLLLVSGVIFAQVHKGAVGALQASSEIKGIHSLPGNPKAVVDSLNYDGVNYTSIGVNGPATFGVYAFFPAATLASHYTAGHSILSEKLFISVATNLTAIELRIYSDTNTLLYSQPFTPVEGWNNVLLTTPFPIPATGDLYIGYHLTTTAGYPAGCDAGPTNANGDWIWMDSWAHLSSFGLAYNWNIRAMCGTVPAVPTAGCSPLSWDAGTLIAPNSVTSGTFTLTNIGSTGPLTCSGISGISAPFTTTLVPASVNLGAGASATFTFTYAPTVAGTTNQTAVIATNGGDINISLTGNAIDCPAITTFPYTEGFEGANFPPDCWTLNDADGDSHNWELAVSPSYASHSGVNSAASASYDGAALTPDNYLITPQFTIPAGNYDLKFWAAPQDPAWPSEKYAVLVSTTGTAPADFTEIFSETLTAADSSYKENVLSLAAYSGQSIYIAFRHFDCTDMFWMKLDDVSIEAASGINETNEELVSIYPNPANDKLNIIANNIESVEIFNLIGETVASYGNISMINTSDLSIGTYIVKVITDSKVFTQKINIVR
ncbi:MAG TPA: choice-of-anchor J domain-containing protein [Bacteroidales bacterium]|nr:choice-of-anchor J domain-containing protein [Bacteroidales bacterium]